MLGDLLVLGIQTVISSIWPISATLIIANRVLHIQNAVSHMQILYKLYRILYVLGFS